MARYDYRGIQGEQILCFLKGLREDDYLDIAGHVLYVEIAHRITLFCLYALAAPDHPANYHVLLVINILKVSCGGYRKLDEFVFIFVKRMSRYIKSERLFFHHEPVRVVPFFYIRHLLRSGFVYIAEHALLPTALFLLIPHGGVHDGRGRGPQLRPLAKGVHCARLNKALDHLLVHPS